jgi:hypothetical protein
MLGLRYRAKHPVIGMGDHVANTFFLSRLDFFCVFFVFSVPDFVIVV